MFPLIVSSCDIDGNHNEQGAYDFRNEINILDLRNSNKVIAKGQDTKVILNKNLVIFRDDDLYTIKFDGSNLFRITNFKSSIYSYDVTVNGEVVISFGQLYYVNYDGTNFRQLTTSKNDREPHFSTKMDKIIFCRDGNICMIDIDGTDFNYVVRHSDSTNLMKPHFIFSDKKIIYYETTNFNNVSLLHLYDLAMQKDTILRQIWYGRDLDISSDNRLLYLDYLLEYRVNILDVLRNENRILDLGQAASFSNDGSTILYSYVNEVYSIDVYGNNKKLIYTLNKYGVQIWHVYTSLSNDYIIFENSPPSK